MKMVQCLNLKALTIVTIMLSCFSLLVIEENRPTEENLTSLGALNYDEELNISSTSPSRWMTPLVRPPSTFHHFIPAQF